MKFENIIKEELGDTSMETIKAELEAVKAENEALKLKAQASKAEVKAAKLKSKAKDIEKKLNTATKEITSEPSTDSLPEIEQEETPDTELDTVANSAINKLDQQ